MRISLEKFGTTLTSRQAGKEAFAAFQPTLRSMSETEGIEIDFAGVSVLTPSWADEFVTPIKQAYGAQRIALLNTDNASVTATLELLESLE